MIDPNLYGLILAGGDSSRMGFDKRKLRINNNNTQEDYLFTLLSEHCGRVFLSCKKEAAAPSYLNPIRDALDLAGPMNGIITALKTYPGSTWLIVAVDMPYIDNEAIRFLLTQRDPLCLATCHYDSTGNKPEPLFSVWEPAALGALENFIQEGNTGVRYFLETHPAKIVYPLNQKVLRNINSPEDLADL